MPLYTVHTPPKRDGEAALERLRVVPDRFSRAAFLLPPFWMLRRRLFIPFALYCVALALILFGIRPWLGGGAALFLVLLLGLGVGFEASSLRRLSLDRRGWRLVGEVHADSPERAVARMLAAIARAARSIDQAIPAEPSVTSLRAGTAPRQPPRRPDAARLEEPRVIGYDARTET